MISLVSFLTLILKNSRWKCLTSYKLVACSAYKEPDSSILVCYSKNSTAFKRTSRESSGREHPHPLKFHCYNHL
ncbi:unnamed protein product [Moneuplotes crassus]|uniref:Uncharacterized protein n=1 Tax=Euplotes crassus TaxID=5936 RepID=A0AAD2D8B7_EUPCR|nr:unnamed protein product [Moneuplotes crassus]